MKTIKINFADQWSNFKKNDNFIIKFLKTHYNVVLSDKPDFLFCGCNMSGENKRYFNCVKILISGENFIPDFNVYDYGIGSAYLQFGDRYFRKPPFMASKDVLDRSKVNEQLTSRKFCNFIYRNSNWPGTKVRIDFCKKLQLYKHVDCPGLSLHNIDCIDLAPRNGDWYRSKQKFLEKYKFTIAFENSFSEGYTTEKLIQPFYAYSIPIYWGNPLVVKEFNSKAFINCNDYGNDFDAVIEKVKELNSDNNKYLEMLSEPPMAESFDFDREKHFREWIIRIIERGNRPFDKGLMFNNR